MRDFDFRTRKTRIAAIAFALLAAAGCTSDTSDLQQFIAQERAKQPGPIEPLPQIQPYETFTYEAHALRSPFVPDTEFEQDAGGAGAGSGSGIQPDFSRNKEYLEQFPLDALTMVGTVEIQGQSFALVSDPDGAVHRIQPGNYLGQNHGKVASISETQINVTEIIPDGLGGWMERQAAIGLDE